MYSDESDEPTNPTADNVIDSTEVKRDSDEEEGRHERVTNGNTNGRGMVGDQSDDEDAGGLFGSGSEDEGTTSGTTKARKIDDEELDSGDDENRNDRMEEDIEGYDDDGDGREQKAQNILDLKLGRHRIPRGSDGELYHLRYPTFLSQEPKAFVLKDFQPPTTDHHSSTTPSSTFSASQVANSTIRWRRSPNNPNKLQSNARILRWSDGSLTLQLGTHPLEQYTLPAKPLAPPQRNPITPTPTSISGNKAMSATYDPKMDSHTYLSAPHISASFVRITNHITTSLQVQSTTNQDDDDAIIRLEESLASLNRGKKAGTDGGVNIVTVTEDPELAKKKAELAEKEKIRAQRRRQNQEERERDRANRVLGRSGLRTGGPGAGLTIGSLEDDATGATRPRTKPARKPRRRNSEYSDDEEDFRNRGKTREDEYDEDDGFLVGSDEEPEVVPDESEEEEEMGDDPDDPEEKPRKSSGSKPRPADGEEGGRAKRRRVVDEDDDDE